MNQEINVLLVNTVPFIGFVLLLIFLLTGLL